MTRWVAEEAGSLALQVERKLKRFLLKIWRILPYRLQVLLSVVLRPRYQVAACAIILNEQGQLLLCEHTYRRLCPWGLPGGDLKFGEDPQDGVKREVFEETGLTVQDVRLLQIESSQEVHRVILTYLCTGVSGTFVPNEEVSRMEYYDTTALPELYPEHLATIEKALAVLKAERVTR